MKLGERLVQIARASVGMIADPYAKMPDGSNAREAFENLMGYGETVEIKRAMSSYHGVSTCGLFIRGLLWAAMYRPAALSPPYIAGSVFTRLQELARAADAWVEAPTLEFTLLTDPGDIVMVGLEGSAGHAFIVEEVTLKGRYKVVVRAIEAGQVAVRGGFQCVARKEHVWAIGAGGFIDSAVTVDGPDCFPGQPRRLSGWIRASALEAGPVVTPKPVRRTTPIAQPAVTPSSTPPFLFSTPGNPTCEGVDISHANQGTFDWDVAAKHINFVVAKAGEGSALRGQYEDPTCAGHCAGALSAGLAVGLYHYLHTRVGETDASIDADALAQAEAFARIVERERPDFLWCDVELAGNEKAQPTQVLYTHALWSTHMERLVGKRPVLYSFDGYLEFLGTPRIPGADRYRLARANYSAPVGTPAPGPWGTAWVFWQHSASPPLGYTERAVDASGVEWAIGPSGARSRLGRVDGIPGYVDRSVFRGRLGDLKTL